MEGQWGAWRHRISQWGFQYDEPPYDLGGVYMPELGVYSARDSSVLRQHCYMMANWGIGAALFQWWGGNVSRISWGSEISSSVIEESLVMLFDACREFGVQVGVEILPYQGRNVESVRGDILYLVGRFGSSPNVLSVAGRPVVVVRDSAALDSTAVFDGSGAFLIATAGAKAAIYDAMERGFDGVTSASALDCEDWASCSSSWHHAVPDCASRGFLFIPGVAPGVREKRPMTSYVRGEMHESNRRREGGSYFRRGAGAAADSGAKIVIVNSWNDWLKGTGIEPAAHEGRFPLGRDAWGEEADDGDAFLRMTKEMASRLEVES